MGAFTYPRSEPGSGGHMDLVERLGAVATALRSEVSELPEDTIAARPDDGGWSIKQLCGHLRDNASFLHQRLAKMIKLEQPDLESWDQDAEMERRNPQDADTQELLAEFASQRRRTVEMLTELVHWNWARTGRHEEYGRISIRQLVDRALAHEEGHLQQIRAMKEQAAGPTAST